MRAEFEEAIQQLQALGFQLAATPGTAEYYTGRGLSGIVALQKPTEPTDSTLAGIPVVLNSGTVPVTDTSARNYRPDVAHHMNTSNTSTGTGAGVGLGDGVGVGTGAGGDAHSSLPIGSVVEWIRTKCIDLVINIPEGSTRSDEVTAGYLMRRTAVDFGCSLLTNIK